MKSLWGFSKENLKYDIKETPHGVLKEQIEHFEKNTNDILHARIRNITISSKDCEFPLSTTFEIVAPSLGGYTCKLFTMYCKPEMDYPVLIYVKNIESFSEIDEFTADYLCENFKSFVDAIEKVLSSPSTTRIIQTLYSKSNL